MKKLLIILILFVSCNKESICDCTKSHYTIQSTIVFDENGLPHFEYSTNLAGIESVGCQDEVQNQSTSNNSYFNITCD